MTYHIITSTYFDFDMFDRRASEDRGPRHGIIQLAKQLNAEIHQVNSVKASILDRFAGKIFGKPEHWALCRKVLSKTSSEDVIYCTGEDVGFPLAFLTLLKPNGPKIVMAIMSPDRVRTRYLINFLGLGKKIDLYIVNDRNKYDCLKDKLGIPENMICQAPEQTDATFFRPEVGTLRGSFPLIASAGLESRDYSTLAQAIEGEDVYVKVCAFSPNSSSKTRTRMPDEMPKNMEARYFDFQALRDLYCSADIVVISLLPNNYSAGLTVLMEAMACKRPVIITRNPGLAAEVIDKGLVLGFEPGDKKVLKQKIFYLLSNPLEAERLADKAYQYFLKNHTSDHKVNLITQKLEEVAMGKNSLRELNHIKFSLK